MLLTLSGSVGLCYSFFCNGFVTFICAFPKPKEEEEQTIVLYFLGNTFTVIVLYCCHNYFEPHVLDNMILRFEAIAVDVMQFQAMLQLITGMQHLPLEMHVHVL